MRHILVTGGTGFLGWDIVKELLRGTSADLYILARDKNKISARKRVSNLINKSFKGKEKKEALKRIKVIKGDVVKRNLGIKASVSSRLQKKIDTIYHSAALCEFGVPWKEIKKINVDGTRNILDFALKCKKNGQFESFHHISTVAVAGKAGGVFYEDDLGVGQGFNNTYERSKFNAEKLVRRYRRRGLNISVYRPSIVSGNSVTGEASNLQLLYQPLHIFSLGLFDDIPGDASAKYDVVPVDYVARAVYLLSGSGNHNNSVFHLSNPSKISLDRFLSIASHYFGFKKPKIIPQRKYDFNKLQGFRKKLIESYLPYFNRKKIIINTSNFNKSINFSWPLIDRNLLSRLFKYCLKSGYIKKNLGYKL